MQNSHFFFQHEPRYNAISWRVAIQILRIKTHSHRHVLLLQQRGTGGTVDLIRFLRTVISDAFLGIVKHPAAKLLRSTETVTLWDAMWQWLTNSATFVWQDPAFPEQWNQESKMTRNHNGQCRGTAALLEVNRMPFNTRNLAHQSVEIQIHLWHAFLQLKFCDSSFMFQHFSTGPTWN